MWDRNRRCAAAVLTGLERQCLRLIGDGEREVLQRLLLDQHGLRLLLHTLCGVGCPCAVEVAILGAEELVAPTRQRMPVGAGELLKWPDPRLVGFGEGDAVGPEKMPKGSHSTFGWNMSDVQGPQSLSTELLTDGER